MSRARIRASGALVVRLLEGIFEHRLCRFHGVHTGDDLAVHHGGGTTHDDHRPAA